MHAASERDYTTNNPQLEGFAPTLRQSQRKHETKTDTALDSGLRSITLK